MSLPLRQVLFFGTLALVFFLLAVELVRRQKHPHRFDREVPLFLVFLLGLFEIPVHPRLGEAERISQVVVESAKVVFKRGSKACAFEIP